MTDDLIRKDTTELAGLIASRQVSPVELTEACLRRIDALNPTLNAFLTVCGDEAMESAREAEKSAGPDMPPLHGIPCRRKGPGGNERYQDDIRLARIQGQRAR